MASRRQFVLFSAVGALAPAFGLAQQAGQIPRVGVLHAGHSNEASSVQREPFERGLRELGWVPGSTVLIDYRYAEGNAARLVELAADLVRSDVRVIVARGNPAIHAARQASGTIPIVMSAGEDPEGAGFAKNLSRPGTNITGVTNLIYELDGKRLEVLKEAFSHISRVAVLVNPNFDGAKYEERQVALQAAARRLNLQAQVFEVRSTNDLASALLAISNAHVDALLVRGDPQVLDPNRTQIVAIAAKKRLPAIYPWRFFVEVGGLMSYGASLQRHHYRAATYVSRILKGANPAELAIEQPSKFDLIVNLKTAKSLGMEIPKAVLFRADEIIQ
jgi:putative ABC transport system substrate-binding protein